MLWKDLCLVAYLRKNGRETVSSLAKRLGKPISTVHEQLKRLQEKGTISRFTCLFPYTTFGFHARAMVILKAKKDNREDMQDYLAKHPHINALYRINRNYDFLCDIITKDMRHLEEFLESLEVKFSTKTEHIFYVIEELKTESFLSDPSIIHLLQE
ncbi:Lrp/AsnC family transcriptional regulator [Candidatus Woesearchaeota archaeon]|nr:Lrp/AsnC family transcriptional regulator [Candidatus Woesearchaeota archaeon]